MPLALIVRRENEHGVVDDAASGVEVQQLAPVQVRVCDPSIRMAGSDGAEQLEKLMLSLLLVQPDIRDQLQDGTAQALGNGCKK